MRRLFTITSTVHTVREGMKPVLVPPGAQVEFNAMPGQDSQPRELRIAQRIAKHFMIEKVMVSPNEIDFSNGEESVRLYGKAFLIRKFRRSQYDLCRMQPYKIFTVCAVNISNKPQSFDCEVWGVFLQGPPESDSYYVE